MSDRTGKKAFCVLMACAIGGLGAASAMNLPKGISSDDVLLYSSFDKGEAADMAKGQTKVISYANRSKEVPGKAGNARALTDVFTYDAVGNISKEAGTVAFWFSPAWDPADKKHHSLIDWRGKSHGHDRILLYKYAGSNDIYYGLRSTKGSKATRKVTVCGKTAGWKPGEWHHIIGTWDGAVPGTRLYVDGKLIGKTKHKWEFGEMPKRIYVGSKGTTLDDLLILKRALTDEEATALYAGYGE